MKKLTTLMLVSAVVMAVAAAALVAAVRYAADSAPEIIDTAVDQISASVDSAVSDAVSPQALDTAFDQVETNMSRDSESASTPTSPTPALTTAMADSNTVGPAAGTAMTVVGVRWDDVLNVRDAPNGNIIARLRLVLSDTRGDEIDVLAPDGDDVVAVAPLEGVIAAGQTEALRTTVWHRVEVGSTQGWVSDAYVAPIGGWAGHIADLLGRHLDSTENYENLSDIEAIVRNVLTTMEPNAELVTTVPGGFVEAVGELAMDVIGVHDERLRGYRLRIWMRTDGDWMVLDPSEVTGPFTVQFIEVFELCSNIRGIDADGRCR
ncbi:MAG: hypothetical protein OXH86_01140 [Acidimicrobiaceae bacterium]|nr:hypothetical protein [Acidimicrobiaceae bacterium]